MSEIGGNREISYDADGSLRGGIARTGIPVGHSVDNGFRTCWPGLIFYFFPASQRYNQPAKRLPRRIKKLISGFY